MIVQRLTTDEVEKNQGKNDHPLQVVGGKRNKDRLVYLPTEAISIVKRWLKVREQTPGALLCPIWKSGKIQLRAFGIFGDV